VNLAVLLFGTAGLFAKWIHLPAVAITFGRVLFSSITLGLFMLVRKESFAAESRKDLMLLILAGAVLALHWWSFLQSIQLSTVAIGTVTFSSFPLFVTFLEPAVFHQKPSRKNILTAVVILIGVFVTVPSFSFENHMFRGILTGLFSALTYAVLTIMNKSFTGRYSGTMTAFYEQSSAAVFLLPFALKAGFHPTFAETGMLVFLGIFTTAAAHTLFISSLRDIPAQLAGICSSMETVYGILFAFLFLSEVPSLREIIGAVIIIGAVAAAQLSETAEIEKTGS
jgi:drug/metabolite transporter (DMT)-like permease